MKVMEQQRAARAASLGRLTKEAELLVKKRAEACCCLLVEGEF